VAKPAPVRTRKEIPHVLAKWYSVVEVRSGGRSHRPSSFGNTARADELVVVGPRPGHFIPTGEAKVVIGEERVARTGNIPMAPSPVTSAKAEDAH
jgi:hypothetical protein